MNLNKINSYFSKLVLVGLIAITLAFGTLTNPSNAIETESTYQKTDTEAVTMGDKAAQYTQPGAKVKESIEETKDTVVDKLNLDEGLPDSTKKFIKQIQGKEPIENETRPK